MSNNRKMRADRIIILFLILAILVLGLGFGVYKILDSLLGKHGNNNGKDPVVPVVVDPEPVKTSEGVKVELNDYDVYIDDTESLGFNFVIAELHFTADEPISFDLGNLQTSEHIYLNNVAKDINSLAEKSYRVSDLGIVNSIVTNSNDYTCKVFVPYRTNSSSLRLLNTEDKSMIEFDLTKNNKYVTTMKFDTDSEIVVGETNIRVSKSYISTMMTHNGDEYDASGLNYYTFNIYVEKVECDIKIVDAIFVRNSSDEQLHCLNNEYASVKVANCLNKTLVQGENGALFFEESGRSGITDFDGFLMLMLSNSSDWIKVPTTLE